MTAVALATVRRMPVDLEQEILIRIERGGLDICEAELRCTLRWDERSQGSMLELLDELEHGGLIESAMHFRLTEQGRAQLPEDQQLPLRWGTGISWTVRS
jgi:DNA-binding PadR family transcriptional regulator